MNICFFRQLLLLLLCVCAVQSQHAMAIACSDIFTNGIQAHASNGNIRLDYHSIITGGSATLTARTLTDNTAWVACSGSSCVATGTAANTSTPTFLTGNGANGAVNVGYQASVSIASGNYTTVNVAQEGTLTFSSANGVYRTGALTTNFKSILRLQSGDYWINGNLTIDQETVLRRIASSGPTRIFVNGNVNFGYKAYTDGFSSNQLLIYATGSITSANELNFTGYLYAGGNVSLNFLSTVNGAISGANFIGAGNQVTVNYQGSNLSSADFTPFCSGATVAPVLLGSWNMDEGSWNGTANEVKDSSGQGNHGRARIAAGSTPLPSTGSGGPAYTSGNQNTCYYGAFDGTGSPIRSRTYVELTGFPALPLGFTFAAWIRSSNASAQHQRILVRDDAQNGWGFSLADGTGQPKLRFFGRNITNNGAVTGQGSNPNCGVFCLDTNAVISSNQWHYVAAVVDTSAKTVTLYVYSQARVLLAKTTAAYSGTWSDGTGTAAIGGETSASSEGQDPSWHFLGNIDEVNIYSGALTQTNIEALMQTVRTCAGPDHYEVQIAAQSIACEGATVTVRACANSAVPCNKDASVSANVTLGTNAGVFSSTSTASVVLGFTSGEATTKLLYPSAIEDALATLTLSGETVVANNSRKCCTGPSNCSVANTCSTTFNRAGFIFSSTGTTAAAIPTQIAGVTDNNVYLRSVRSDDATGACVARFTSPQTVQLGYQCRNPLTCITGQTLFLGTTNITGNSNSVADGSISYSNASLTFNSNGAAPIPFNYSDVGNIRLHARLALGAGGGEPAYTMTGISNDFVVKPHTLAVSAVTNAANTATPGTTNSGVGFVPAGEKFKVSVQARNASNNPTPNFGKEIIPEINSVTLSANSLVYPTGGTLTALTNGGVFTTTTPAGTFVNSDIQWNQVGSIIILPALTVAPGNNGYLEQGAIQNYVASGTVGRFYPDHFSVLLDSDVDITNGCSAFSYMGQPHLNIRPKIRAESTDNTIVTNYDNFDLTYSPSMATPIYAAENATNGANLGGRLSVTTGKWNDGIYNDLLTGTFARSNLPDGPFAQLSVGVASMTDTFDPIRTITTTKNMLSGTAVALIDPTQAVANSLLDLRFGRLRLDDAFGPETANLPVNFATEYWAGNYFTKNLNDNCTKILRSAITYPAGNILNPANLTITLTGGVTTGNYGSMDATQINFSSGSGQHYFSVPTGGGRGQFNVDIDLTSYPWLRFDWDQNGVYDDVSLPTARFGFGSYRGHDRIIYWRERF